MATGASDNFGGRANGSSCIVVNRPIALPLKYLAKTAVALLLAAGTPALAQQPQRVAVGELNVYWGILPAAMVLGHEQEHGGSKTVRDAHHLVVALFDSATGSRVSEAEVEARVGPLGLAAETKKLEPMTINQTLTYGNYFKMPGTGPYRITLRIRSAGTDSWMETSFDYR